MKNYLAQMYKNARLFNDQCILKSLSENGPFDRILDVGCWDGKLTLSYALACKATTIFGIEVVKDKAEEANAKGIKTYPIRADQDRWPFDDESLDCVISNQVIEHLSDVDFFFKEASRVLRKGGCLITSTNNLGSWHNIAALHFGWTPFDLTNSSKRSLGIGNPLSVHRGEVCEEITWTHKCIYTPRWLFEWQQLYGLRKVSHLGSGLYPFSEKLGVIIKNHAAFMIPTTVKN